MNLFRRPRRDAEPNFRLISDIRVDLSNRYSRPQGGEIFIHPNEARRVLERERVRDLLSPFPWYRENDLTYIYQKMALIICILIISDWQEWGKFKDHFYGNIDTLQWPKVEDKDLPLPDDTQPFLPQNLWQSFMREQYTFYPVFIDEDSHDSVYDSQCRLPILTRKRLEEESSQGIVEKVEVDGRFIRYADGRSDPNIQLMAMKHITAKKERDFKAELKASKEFIKCLTHHNNIMRSLSSFVHGSNFVILFPWAEGRDLDLFLYSPDRVLTNFPERSRHFSPNNLLIEAYSLAHALNFLHRGMVTERGRMLRCAHLDLKPENILVCFPLNASPETYPVGRWKITDFGMANIEESVVSADVVPEQQSTERLAPGNLLRELSIQPPKRGAGPFQPPEVQSVETAKVSTRRDVWSFGCILAMILAFALGGPEEVLKQQRLRARGDDYFYRHRTSARPENRRTVSSPHRVDAEVKPNIRKWLSDDAPALHDPSHRPWITACSNLILGLLQVDVVSRPEIDVAISDLSRILEHTEALARERMWLFGEASSAPEVTTTIINLAPRPDTNDSGGAFIGITASPPSSAPSPTRGNPSSASRSSLFRPDDSLAFLNVEPPPNASNACVSPSGKSVALHSDSIAYIYDLTQIQDDNNLWTSVPANSNPWLSGGPESPARRHVIRPSPQRIIVEVTLHEGFISVLERQSTFWFLRVFTERARKYEQFHHVRLRQKPQIVKLSCIGYCAVKYDSNIDIHVPGRPQPVPIDLEVQGQQQLHFHGLEFSRDGAYMCLWERDRLKRPPRGQTASPVFYHWTVWDASLRTICDTISHIVEPYDSMAQAQETHLIPFHSYPRFVACGSRNYIYLIRADGSSNRVVHLGHSANIQAGLVLPDDDGFILIRASQHGKQKAERIALTSLGGVSSWKPYACGRLYKDLDKAIHGFGIRNLNVMPETPALVSLTPDGILVRKQL